MDQTKSANPLMHELALLLLPIPELLSIQYWKWVHSAANLFFLSRQCMLDRRLEV